MKANKEEKTTATYYNIQGITSNIEQLRIITQENKPKLIFLSETHLTKNILNREVGIANYNLLRSDSNSRHTGGVAIYIKKSLNYKVISNKQINNNMWILSIEINENKTLNGQYTVLYHSPSSSDADFIKFFSEWIEKNHNEEKKHIICGDFNIDMAHYRKVLKTEHIYIYIK